METSCVLLAAREDRYARQQRLLNSEGVVLVQVSLNLPGGFAVYPWEDLIAEANAAVRSVLGDLGLQVLEEWNTIDVLGPCSGFVMLGDARSIKLRCIDREEAAPRGRMWDIDVLTQAGAVDRPNLGVKGRLCWVCGQEEALVCRRLGAHSLAEVVTTGQKIARGGND